MDNNTIKELITFCKLKDIKGYNGKKRKNFLIL